MAVIRLAAREPLAVTANSVRYCPLSFADIDVPKAASTRSITSRSVMRHETIGQPGPDGVGFRNVPSASSNPASHRNAWEGGTPATDAFPNLLMYRTYVPYRRYAPIPALRDRNDSVSTRLTLEDLGERTKVRTVSVFATKEDRDGMIDAPMEVGLNESFAALDGLLERLQSR
jgi:hypothetical protein